MKYSTSQNFHAIVVIIITIIIIVIIIIFIITIITILMLLLLSSVRFTFLEGNTYYIRQQAGVVWWQKPEKIGFEHP